MINELLAKYSKQKVITLFVLLSVVGSNILTFVVMLIIPADDYVLAHTMATVVSFLAALVLAIFATNIYYQFLEARMEAIENYKIDSLTGLYSRKPFLDLLEYKLNDTSSLCEHMCVFLIDLDNFKSINDTYGHLGGDAVMQKVGDILNQYNSDQSIVARFGGEEFVFVSCHIEHAHVKQLAEDIRHKLDGTLMYRNEAIHFSASVGCYYTHLPTNDIEEILRLADIQLYKAKDNGRNRVEYLFDN